MFCVHTLAIFVTACFLSTYAQRPERVVVSMTTSPKRIGTLSQTIASLLAQDTPVDLVQINIPWVFARNNQTFPNLEELSFLQNNKIRVHRCEDMGPATKLVPTLDLESDPDTVIIILDDDQIYPPTVVTSLARNSVHDPTFFHAGVCVNSVDVPVYSIYHQGWKMSSEKGGDCCCRFFEAYRGVAFRRSFFSNTSVPFAEYMKIALANEACFRSDDFVFSNYMAALDIQGMSANYGRRVEALPESNERGSLHNIGHGHPYHRCSHYLALHNVSYLRFTGMLDYPAPDGTLIRHPKEQQIYAIINNTRRPIPNVDVFYKHGFDFGNVRIAHNRDFVEHFFPLGPSLS